MTATPNQATPALPPLSTPDVPGTPPPNDPQTVWKPDIPFGSHIESIAAWSGLHPVDVALGIAGVLTNIAGPYAGLVDATGGRVPPHLNLLRVGDTTPRMHTLEARLFHPLRTRTTWLRHSASSHSRSLADRCVFGEHMPSSVSNKKSKLPFYLHEQCSRGESQQEKLFTEQGLDRNQFNEIDPLDLMLGFGSTGDPVRSTTGPVHLPSLFFEGLPLDRITAALSESIHREAFLHMPRGGLFDPSPSRSTKDDQLAADLVALLRGRDSQFPPLHPDQGPGTFEYARVHLWAAMTIDRMGETLQDGSSIWNELYQHCLLWDVSAGKAGEDKIYNPSKAWQHYDDKVHQLLNLRCFGNSQSQMRLLISASYESQFSASRNTYLGELEKIQSTDNTFIAQFHDLPDRLLWVFLQLRSKEDAFWCRKAAFTTALYAAEMHGRLLKQAREKNAERINLIAQKEVTSILARKGPCNLREMQRSSNNRRAAFFKPILKSLEQQGCLRVDEHNRFQLIGQS
jgi:hypothetical protein